jgi:TonB family protein
MGALGRVVAVASFGILALLPCDARRDAWVEVRSPNFIVVSNAGDAAARRSALQFEEIRAVFRQSLMIASSHPTPVVTVLAVADEASMRKLLPEYWVKDHAHPSGLYADYVNLFFAAVELDAHGASPFQTFYHEYFHTITVPYFPDLPVWLSEGLAEFYGHTEIDEKHVRMGQSDPELLAQLRDRTLIPLNVLFAVDTSSPYYNEADKTSLFYAESWALTHYLMLGDHATHASMLKAYLEKLDQGNKPDEAERLAFGDLKKLQFDLQAYVHNGGLPYLKVTSPKIDEGELNVRHISEAEACAYRGGFAAVRGQAAVATAALEEALRLDPKLVRAYQYLGVTQFLTGQREPALEFTSKAIALDPGNSFTHYFRAFVDTSSLGTMLNDPRVEGDLRQAIELTPDFVPPYALLAVYFAAGNRNLPEALAFAEKAVALEPGSSEYQLALARVLASLSRFDEANVAGARANAFAQDSVQKTNAQSFLSYLAQLRQLQTTGGDQLEVLPAETIQHSGNDGSESLRLGTQWNQTSKGPSPPPATALQVEVKTTILSDRLDVDFQPYIQEMLPAIHKKLVPSVTKSWFGPQGSVSVEFAVLPNGEITRLTLVSGSGDKILDQAAREGVAASSPLPPLPSEFRGQYLQFRLRYTFTEWSPAAR